MQKKTKTGLPKIRFETHGTETHVFLDDQEIRGVTGAVFAYDVNKLPLVHLELMAIEVVVESDEAVVEIEKNKEED